MAYRRYALISAIVFIIGVGNISDNFQITIFNSNTKEPGDIKLISYNVKNFDERDIKEAKTSTKNEILNFITEEDADIVCIQEYHSASPKLYEPLKKIRDTLGMTSYYYESYFNPEYNQLVGIVTFSKYSAVNKGRLKFPGSRTFGIYTDLMIGRDTVRVFNIHLASIKLAPSDLDFVTNPDAKDGQQFKNITLEIYYKLTQAYNLREKQLKYLVDKIKSTPYKILLCGDFNDTPSSWVYHQANQYLTDTFVKKGSGLSTTYAGPIPYLRIDYILTSDAFSTIGFTRHKINISDHYPISAIVRNH